MSVSESNSVAKNIAAYPGAARERLLHAASDLFCRCGINATGVDTIVDAAGTAKTTLYKAYGSKEGLIEAVLEHEGSVWREWFSSEVDACPGDAKERLVYIFKILKKWFSEENFYGCPFINAVGEHDKDNDRIRHLTMKHKKIVLGKVQSLIEEAGIDDSEDLTHEFGLLIDGAIVSALVTRNAGMADYAKSAAMRLLKMK